MKKHIKQFLLLLLLILVTSSIGIYMKEYYGWNNALYLSGWIGGSLYTSFKVFIV